MNSSCTEPTNNPIAQEIVNFANQLAERATLLLSLAEKKLAPVIIPILYQPQVQEDEKQTKEYSPLFQNLLISLQTISISLNAVENTILKTQL